MELDDLPGEVLVAIFSWLPVPNLCSLRCVCKTWLSLVHDDLLWKGKLREYLNAREEDLSKMNDESWMQAFQRVFSCKWDRLLSHSQISLSNDNRRAEHTGDGSHHAAISSMGVRSGVHYFEVDIVQGVPATTNTFGVGIGNQSMKGHGSYCVETQGIGWYNDGNTFVLGSLDYRLPAWKQGDKLGVLMNFEVGQVAFFKNDFRVSNAFPLPKLGDTEQLHIVCLMHASAAATIKYRCRTCPTDVDLTGTTKYGDNRK
jgi:hypothetical protein